MKGDLNHVSHHCVCLILRPDTHTHTHTHTYTHIHTLIHAHTQVLVTLLSVSASNLTHSTMLLFSWTLKMENTRFRDLFSCSSFLRGEPSTIMNPKFREKQCLNEWSASVWVLLFQLSLKASSLPILTGNFPCVFFFPSPNSSSGPNAGKARSSDSFRW